MVSFWFIGIGAGLLIVVGIVYLTPDTFNGMSLPQQQNPCGFEIKTEQDVDDCSAEIIRNLYLERINEYLDFINFR